MTVRLTGDRSGLVLEISTVGALVLVALAFARPLAEEWKFIEYFDRTGLAGYPALAKTHFLRPLMPIPFALEWLLGRGRPFGFALGCALMIAARYLVARWAASPVLHPTARWVFAMLMAALLSWPAAWQLRYSETQLSLVFFLVALGAVLRLVEKFSLGWTLAGAAGVALMLGTYQALLVCALAMPFITLCIPTARSGVTFDRALIGRFARTSAPVALGCALYAAYALAVSARSEAPAYEVAIFQSGAALRSWSGLTSALAELYRTAYVDSGVVLPLMVAILSLAIGRHLVLGTGAERYRDAALLLGALLLLPVLAAPYSIDAFRRLDPDRVLFPVSVGFALLTLAALCKYNDAVVRNPPGRLWGLALAIPVLLTTTIDASGWHRHYVIEDDVLNQTMNFVRERQARSVVLRDFTGTLGDIFVYQSVFEEALSARGLRIAAILCTPLGVDRVGSVARRLGTQTSPRCEDTPAPPGALLLDASASASRDRTTVSLGTAESATPGRGFSGSESGASEVWWWMISPAGIIRVTGEPASTVMVSLSLIAPPCGPVQASVNGKSVRVIGRAGIDVAVPIDGLGSGAISIAVSDGPCRTNDPRDLFVAVSNPVLTVARPGDR